MKIMLFLLLFLSPTHVLRGPAPRIIEQHTIVDFKCDNQLGCQSQSVTIYNPQSIKLIVKVNCGSELDESEVKLFPHVKNTAWIELNLPLGREGCKLGTWRPTK